MSNIVFDLEWNQAGNKELENPRLGFEIIEIGAVKLDDNGKIIDRFSQLVRPVVYPMLFYHVKSVVQLSTEQLKRHGRGFRTVVQEFISWCGDDPVFYTWGSMDLTELQRNIEYYGMENPFKFPLFYYDVQKLYSIYKTGTKSQIALELAIAQEGIKTGPVFHRAANDAEYTARILALLEGNNWKELISVDYYRLPTCKENEIYLVFEGYSKLVSRLYPTREEAMGEKNVVSTTCYKCHKNAAKKIKWFTDNNKNYYSLALCPEHGWLKGKIRVRHRDDEVYVVKTMKLVDDEGARSVREKSARMKEKRKRAAEAKERAANETLDM